MSVKLDKKTNTVEYSRKVSVTPFAFPVLPCDRDQFSILIMSDAKSPVLINLVQLILNSFTETSSFITGDSLYSVKKEFSDLTQTEEQLKRKVALIDLSLDGQFKDIHPSMVPCAALDEFSIAARKTEHNYTKWVHNHLVQHILFPNTLLQNSSLTREWSKNYSHTIWFASSMDEIPKVLQSNSHMIFITEVGQISAFMKQTLGVEYKIDNDHILVIASMLSADIKLMILPRKRFDFSANN